MSGSSASALPQLGEQLLAGGHVLPVLRLGVVAVGQLHQRPDAGQRDRRILPPRHVGEVVHGVVTPAELEEEVVELPAEVAALRRCRRGRPSRSGPSVVSNSSFNVGLASAVRLSAHRPAGRRRRRSSGSPAASGRPRSARRAARPCRSRSQNALLDSSTKLTWPWIHHWSRHPLGQLVELGDQLVVGERRPVRGSSAATFLAMTSGFHSSSHVLPIDGTLSASFSW